VRSPPKKSASVTGWIKWEKDIETDPRFLKLVPKVSRLLRDMSVTGALPVTATVVGALVRMWSYADTHIRSDDTLDLGADGLDALIGIPGFCSVLPEDWIVVVNDECVDLPGYQDHNGVEAKKRDQATKRQQLKRSRDRHASVTHVTRDSVTPALPDQTRPDQTKPDQRESAPPRESKIATPGLIETGSNLTRSLDEWRSLKGIDAPSFERWLGHLTTAKRLTLNPEQRVIHAEELIAQGGPAEQADVVKFSIGRDAKSLIPIADVRQRRAGMSQTRGGTGRKTLEDYDRESAQRLAALPGDDPGPL
jgi:hypothetical protein